MDVSPRYSKPRVPLIEELDRTVRRISLWLEFSVRGSSPLGHIAERGGERREEKEREQRGEERAGEGREGRERE